jgi:NAD(P)-dependent dehydrogenase (short-subunit alcohol dehydrogenase family)
MAKLEDTRRKVAWVTGANRGMGAETAVRLAAAGYDIALTARDAARLETVAEEVRAHGVRALPLPSDLTDLASIHAFADGALKAFGHCDVLCNFGIYKGRGQTELMLETEPEDLAAHFTGDVIAAFVLFRRALDSMLERGGGAIINMSSSSVFLDPPGTVKNSGWSFAYVAAKAGIDQMASIINVELGDRGVKAFTVEPGFVAYGEDFAAKLRKYPDAPVSPPEAIGPAIVWLVENEGAQRLLGKRISLPHLTHKHTLLDGWAGPGSRFDTRRA